MEHVIITVEEYKLMKHIFDAAKVSNKYVAPRYRHSQRAYYAENKEKILRQMKQKPPRRTVTIRLDDNPPPTVIEVPAADAARY